MILPCHLEIVHKTNWWKSPPVLSKNVLPKTKVQQDITSVLQHKIVVHFNHIKLHKFYVKTIKSCILNSSQRNYSANISDKEWNHYDMKWVSLKFTFWPTAHHTSMIITVRIVLSPSRMTALWNWCLISFTLHPVQPHGTFSSSIYYESWCR